MGHSRCGIDQTETDEIAQTGRQMVAHRVMMVMMMVWAAGTSGTGATIWVTGRRQ